MRKYSAIATILLVAGSFLFYSKAFAGVIFDNQGGSFGYILSEAIRSGGTRETRAWGLNQSSNGFDDPQPGSHLVYGDFISIDAQSNHFTGTAYVYFCSTYTFDYNCNSGRSDVIYYASASIVDGIYTGSSTVGFLDNSSRIIDISPHYSDSISTTSTTTLSFHVFIDPRDVGDDIKYTVYSRNGGLSLILGNEYDFTVTSTTSGDVYYSTSSKIFSEGSYTSSVSIRSYYLGLLPHVIVASTSQWFAGRESAFGSSTLGIFRQLDGSVSSLDVNSCTVSLSGFNFFGCTMFLLVPDRDVLSNDLNDLKRIAPWGYAFRFYDLALSSSTIALPELSMPVPGLSSNFVLTPWNMLFGTSSVLGQASSTIVVNGVTYGSGRSLRQITEYYWNILWYALLGFAIIYDVVGLGKQVSKKIS